MIRKNLLGSTTVLGVAMLASACGGGLTVDQVREDFDNPSGSVSDENAVIAVNEKRTVSDDSVGVAGAVNPFGSFGLTAHREFRETTLFQQLDARVLLQPTFRSLVSQILGVSTARFALTEGELDGNTFANCFDEQELQRQLSGSVTADGGSGSFSFTMDLGSCTDVMTGTIDVSADFEITRERLFIHMEEAFSQVCEKVTPAAACLDGTIMMEMEGQLQAEISSIMAWDIKADWTENGVAQSAASKGGLRLNGFSSGGGSAELLVYVRNSDGDEVSFVVAVSADGQGNGVLEIKGSDGSLTCSVLADGSGQCTGANQHDWSANDALVIRQDDRYRFYE